MNVDFDGPSLDFPGLRKPAHEGIKERYRRKSHYFTIVGQSFIKTVADHHGHAVYHNKHLVASFLVISTLGMLNSFFSTSEFRPLKFGLNSNFVHIFVEKLKQFAFDVCTVGRDEGHSTHTTRREAVCQQCNQPGRQAMSHSTAVD